jgi:mRNA interferase HicA
MRRHGANRKEGISRNANSDRYRPVVNICNGRPLVDFINLFVYKFSMNSAVFKRWLTEQGATFKPGKGSHLKVYLNGRQSVLPMHSAELRKGLVETIKKQLGLK